MESIITQFNFITQALVGWAVVLVVTTTVLGVFLLLLERLLKSCLSLRWRYGMICLCFIQLIVVPSLLSLPLMGGWLGTHHAIQARHLSSSSLPEHKGTLMQAGTDQLLTLSESGTSFTLSVRTMVFLMWILGMAVMLAVSYRRHRSYGLPGRTSPLLHDFLTFSRQQSIDERYVLWFSRCLMAVKKP